MKLFGQVVGTLVELVKVPKAMLDDVLLDPPDIDEKSKTIKQLDKVVDAAKEKD